MQTEMNQISDVRCRISFRDVDHSGCSSMLKWCISRLFSVGIYVFLGHTRPAMRRLSAVKLVVCVECGEDPGCTLHWSLSMGPEVTQHV